MIQIVIPDCFGFSKPRNDDIGRGKNRPALPYKVFPQHAPEYKLNTVKREKTLSNLCKRLF